MKVICKKSYSAGDPIRSYKFDVGMICDMIMINSDLCSVIYQVPEREIYVSCNFLINYVYKEGTYPLPYLFEDYFYSIKEIRKMKLNKIILINENGMCK